MRAGAAAGFLLATAMLLAPGLVEPAREAATDLLMRAVPRPEAGRDPVVLVVAAGEADMAALGPWPWPRDRWAALVTRLAEAGAVAIALDLTFVEPAPEDAALTAALAAAPAVVGLLANQGADHSAGQDAARSSLPSVGFGVALLGRVDPRRLLALPGVVPLVVPGVLGAVMVLPGDTVRGVPLLVRVGVEELLPGLALGALARALEAETLVLHADPPSLQLGDASLPWPRDGRLRLHPGRQPVPLLGAAQVLADPAAAAQARGRIVLLGATAPEAAPLRPSVLGPFTPSLLLQAEAVAQLAAGWVPRRLPGVGLAVTFGLMLLWPLGAVAALRFGPTLVDPLWPTLGALLGGGVEEAAAAWRLARERARLMARFAHRLPPGVAAALLAMPEAERLRPERRQVAVVMTDLAGFSAMVRTADPAAVVPLLNAYLAGIEAVVTAEGGTLERLIGDSVLAVFGAPVPQPDHARHALAAARALDRFAEGFRGRPDAVAAGWGETRIGVAAGEVLAGEVGGSRLTWTVCGDAANVAARLQELAKVLGRRGLVAGLQDPALAPPLGCFALRGLAGKVAVHPL